MSDKLAHIPQMGDGSLHRKKLGCKQGQLASTHKAIPMPSIVFIDSRVTDYQSLIDGFTEPAEVFVLDGESDGLTQMVAYLQGRTCIDAIHVISHGSQGALYLGSSVTDSGNLAMHESQLASIGGALTETGDILLYGCNVAQGDTGLQFISSLAQYTGADVAASTNATGAALLGGDWELEDQTGTLNVTPIFEDYQFLLPIDTTSYIPSN